MTTANGATAAMIDIDQEINETMRQRRDRQERERGWVEEVALPDPGCMGGVWLVEHGNVNLNDIVHAKRPGAVVRCYDIDKIKYIPRLMEDYGFVAGMISDGL